MLMTSEPSRGVSILALARLLTTAIFGNRASGAPWIEGRLTFGQLVAEYDNGRMGWVHGVAFSPSGAQLAFTGW